MGSFILNRNIRVSEKFVEPNYQKLLVRESPNIFSLNWPDSISTTFLLASFYKTSAFRFAPKNISYLITQLGKFEILSS